jgi:hypothetical protein
VALTAVERLHDRLDDVDDEHGAARLGERGGERQADVAGADDCDVVAHDDGNSSAEATRADA